MNCKQVKVEGRPRVHTKTANVADNGVVIGVGGRDPGHPVEVRKRLEDEAGEPPVAGGRSSKCSRKSA